MPTLVDPAQHVTAVDTARRMATLKEFHRTRDIDGNTFGPVKENIAKRIERRHVARIGGAFSPGQSQRHIRRAAMAELCQPGQILHRTRQPALCGNAVLGPGAGVILRDPKPIGI